MTENIPEFTDCQNCGSLVPDGGHVHEAHKREFDSVWKNWLTKPIWLCCICYAAVGGKCDER